MALLGSEQAVRDYVEGKSENSEEKTAAADGEFLVAKPLEPKQGTLF